MARPKKENAIALTQTSKPKSRTMMASRAMKQAHKKVEIELQSQLKAAPGSAEHARITKKLDAIVAYCGVLRKRLGR